MFRAMNVFLVGISLSIAAAQQYLPVNYVGVPYNLGTILYDSASGVYYDTYGAIRYYNVPTIVSNENVSPQISNPDITLSVPGIITRNGYPCETHVVNSEGYILHVHRIPHSKEATVIPSKTVLLQHGLLGSSFDWILNGPEKGLAYVLSNAGYDVWMSNVRGNQYSREHTTLVTNSKAYWNFSWHEAAQYDLPAIIDHIISLKGNGTKITYIGHSMGTTILFAMLTLRPEYNNILAAGIALAPVAFFTDFKSPVKSSTSMMTNVTFMETLTGSYVFMPKSSPLGYLITEGCFSERFNFDNCKNVFFSIFGYNEKQFNETLFPVYLSRLGASTSWKTLGHFAQEIESDGKFKQFDYDTHNQQMYGADTPPEYDLSKVTLPLTLFWANNDLMSSEKDVRLLSEKLGSKPEMYLVPDPEFNHIDYLWAIDANSLLNQKILDVINKVNNKSRIGGYYLPQSLVKGK